MPWLRSSRLIIIAVPCRYRWEQLSKTEKTHFGTLAEINMQRAFAFADGKAMDFAIRGVDVDCKFSQDSGDWMIPPEAVDHVILGLWASDDQGLWSLGLIRAADQVLTTATGNRDRKRWLSPVGKAAITWLYLNKPAFLVMPRWRAPWQGEGSRLGSASGIPNASTQNAISSVSACAELRCGRASPGEEPGPDPEVTRNFTCRMRAPSPSRTAEGSGRFAPSTKPRLACAEKPQEERANLDCPPT
jgi:hypothetical protein